MIRFSSQLLKINETHPINAYLVVTKLSGIHDMTTIQQFPELFSAMGTCCTGLSSRAPHPGVDTAMYSDKLGLFGVLYSPADDVQLCKSLGFGTIAICNNPQRRNGQTLVILDSPGIHQELTTIGFCESWDEIPYFHLPDASQTISGLIKPGPIRDAICEFFREDE